MSAHRGNGRSATLERSRQRRQSLAKVCIIAIESTHAGDRNGMPRAMTEIGGKPLLWHNLMHFAAHGIKDFVIAVGPGGERVKRFLLDYAKLSSDLALDLDGATVTNLGGFRPDWSVDLIDITVPQGPEHLRERLGNSAFILTTGDCVTDFEPRALVEFHKQQQRLATLMAVRPQARFGTLLIEEGMVRLFQEKPHQEDGWVSSGVFMLEPAALDRAGSSWDAEALSALAAAREVAVFKHDGFWHRLETLRDRQVLDEQWQAGKAPWQTWE